MKSGGVELKPQLKADGRLWSREKPMLSADSAPLWFKVAAFPLTPTLSLGEREQHHDAARTGGRSKVFKRHRPVLPLPEAEGRGEGGGRLRIVPRAHKVNRTTNCGAGEKLVSDRSKVGGWRTSLALDWKFRRRGNAALPDLA